MHKNFLSRTAGACLAMIFAASLALGQATGGSVTGTVLDPSGDAVPNATVNLRSEAIGRTFTTQTTDAGSYSFPNVPVGDYTLNIESAGFQTATQSIKVALNQESSANVTLQTQGVAASVEVTAAGEALVQTENSQLAQSYESRQAQDLPIFNDPRALGLLSPNVVAQASGVSGAGGSVGGTRPRANSFNVDGVENNDPSTTGNQLNVIQDAIQEVSLLTNNFNAEFGTGAAGIYNIVTQTGTNEFHGRGFIYAQSQRFNAASTSEEFLLQSGAIRELPQVRDIRYGATLGGPIVKNKLFFFGALERNPISGEGAGVTYTAPTAEGLAQIAGLPGASPFVVNLLRNNLVLPSASSSTRSVLGTPIPFGEVSIVTPGGAQQNLLQLNIDHLVGEKDQFRYRYASDELSSVQPGNGDPKFNNLLAINQKLFSATWVRTFTPSLVNELRLGYRRNVDDRPLQDEAFNSFPNITVTPLNLVIGPNENLPQGGFNNSYQAFDAVSYTRGRHTFRVGGEYRNVIFTSQFLPRGRGDYRYATFDALIRDSLPNEDALRGVGFAGFTGNQRKYYLFGQDDWKATPNLTLNLGLRYEYLTIPRDANLAELNAISNVPGVIEFKNPKADKNNIAPRIGIAYSPRGTNGLTRFLFGERGQSALRGGFSLSYYETFQNLYLLQLPPQFQQELDPATAGVSAPFLQNGAIPALTLPGIDADTARAGTGAFVRDAVEPYVINFTLSYQRQLTPTTGIEFRYLGTRGRHLPIQSRLTAGVIDYNRLVVPTFLSAPSAAQVSGLPTIEQLGVNSLFPRRLGEFGFQSNVTEYDPSGNSQYDAGSVSLTRRFSRGISFTSAYTFSKAIDDSTNELFSSTLNPRRPEDFYNRNERGLSAIDVPHRFAASVNYELPFFRSSGNGFLRNVLGGYTINTIFQTQSGQVITPQSGIDSNRNRDSAGDRTIVNVNGVPGTGSGVCAVNSLGQFLTSSGAVTTEIENCGVGASTTVAYFALNPNAQYIQAGLGARTNAGRNTLRTNGFHRTDAVLLKNFRFGEESYNLQFGVEAFNIFNQRIRTVGDFGSPLFSAQNFSTTAGIGVTTPAFANVTSANFNDYSIGNFSGRTVLLRAKFIF